VDERLNENRYPLHAVLREIQETDYGDLADLERISLGLNREDSQGFVDERVCGIEGRLMLRPYSNDLRARVIEAIEAGASCREVAELYELSASVVVVCTEN
jgi:hypothetical protein